MKKTPKITLLIGCPASGKSTYAEWMVKSEDKTFRVSRDEIRFTQFQEVVDPAIEKIITKIIIEQVKTLVQNGWNVILDNCHTKKEYIKEAITAYNEWADIEFKVFDVPLDELKSRNLQRSRQVPNEVIERMHHQLENLKKNFDFVPVKRIKRKDLEYETQNPDLPKALICDLDGTLALMNGRNPFDASKCDEDLLNEPVANILKNYKNIGHTIILLSGREDKFREPTLRFLEKYSIEYDHLFMRKSKDSRKDSIIKTEIFNDEIKDNYFIEFVLDDRNQVVDMWRNDLKLPCFQVYYGNF